MIGSRRQSVPVSLFLLFLRAFQETGKERHAKETAGQDQLQHKIRVDQAHSFVDIHGLKRCLCLSCHLSEFLEPMAASNKGEFGSY